MQLLMMLSRLAGGLAPLPLVLTTLLAGQFAGMLFAILYFQVSVDTHTNILFSEPDLQRSLSTYAFALDDGTEATCVPLAAVGSVMSDDAESPRAVLRCEYRYVFGNKNPPDAVIDEPRAQFGANAFRGWETAGLEDIALDNEVLSALAKGTLAGMLLSLTSLSMFLALRRRKIMTFISRPSLPALGVALAMAVSLQCVFGLAAWLIEPPKDGYVWLIETLANSDGNNLLVMIAAVVFIGPLFEEPAFRAYWLQGMLEQGFSSSWALVLNVSVFAAIHFADLIAGFAMLGLAGATLGWLWIRFRNIWVCWLAHATYNAVSMCILLASRG